MNIWLIQTGEPLPTKKNIRKMRTAILAEKLIEKGHTVLWWASSFDHLKKAWVFENDHEIDLKLGLKVKTLKGWGYTRYAGLARLDEVCKYLKIADIGLSVLHPRVNYLTSLPIKNFEYMCCSIPIIMSDFPFWREGFSDCAVFVRAEGPKDIASYRK